MLEAITEQTRLVFVANPNNPTGTCVTQRALDDFVKKLPPHVIAVFDEAYYDFLPPEERPDTLSYVKKGYNVCLLRTFSKAYGLAGLRIGYALTTPAIAALLHKARQPFNTNILAQEAALAALQDTEHTQRTFTNNLEGLAFYQKAFEARSIPFVPSKANFILAQVSKGQAFFESMLKQGVIIRSMDAYKLPQWVRISIGTPAQNTRCIEALDSIFSQGAW